MYMVILSTQYNLYSTTPVFFEFTGTAAEVISSTGEGALKEYIKRTMKIVHEI